MDLFDGTFGGVPSKEERAKARAEKAERDAELKARAEKAEQLEDYLREELTKAEREAADYSEQIIDATRDLADALARAEKAERKVTELSDEAYSYAEQLQVAERERDEAQVELAVTESLLETERRMRLIDAFRERCGEEE